ncbi:hypothetical protein [Streptomyces halstedii]|uniref:hypothetical protein n=1 Tax=Streptomyces halstedii TaxID=1944 RepID=UPI00345F6602
MSDTTPECPEGLYDPETGTLIRCIKGPGRHEWHQDRHATRWRDPMADADLSQVDSPFTSAANARDDLLAAISFNDAANAGSTPEELVDAYRLEAIADRDAQIIEWLEKKAREEGTSNKERRTRADVLARMADKLSRGAVRPPPSKGPDPKPEADFTLTLDPHDGVVSVTNISDRVRNKLRAEALRHFLSLMEYSAGDAAAEKLLDDNPELAALLAAEVADQ